MHPQLKGKGKRGGTGQQRGWFSRENYARRQASPKAVCLISKAKSVDYCWHPGSRWCLAQSKHLAVTAWTQVDGVVTRHQVNGGPQPEMLISSEAQGLTSAWLMPNIVFLRIHLDQDSVSVTDISDCVFWDPLLERFQTKETDESCPQVPR